jgi:aminoglycoside 3-N-acetyltransferase
MQEVMPNRFSMWQNTAKARIYYALRRCLSQRSRDQLKLWQRRTRKKMGRALCLFYGKYSAAELVMELKAKVPSDCEILMVHSSYDNLLPMYSGAPQEILDELIASCGDRCTLAMPAFCLGGRLRDKRAYYEKNVFDVRRTGSEMGLLTELFRRRPGVKRSLHPTHSICALGPLANELVAGHEACPTRTGYGSPFDFMAKRKCNIVGLGVEWFRVITQTHTAEDMLGDSFPIKFQTETFPVTLKNWEGRQISYDLTVLTTKHTLDNMLLRSFLSENELQGWKYRGTPLFVTHAGKVTQGLLKAAQRGITVYGTGEQT